MTDRLGEFLRDGDRLGIRYVRLLRQPTQVVWRAITESDQLQHWLPCDIVGELATGASVTLEFWPSQVERHHIPPAQVRLPGEVRVWEPPQVFEWKWDADVLRFELFPERSGTRLVFTTWIGDSDANETPPAGKAAGYHICLEQLQELVESGRVRIPLVDQSPARLQQAYEQSRKSEPESDVPGATSAGAV